MQTPKSKMENPIGNPMYEIQNTRYKKQNTKKSTITNPKAVGRKYMTSHGLRTL